LDSEKRGLIGVIANYWDKYALSKDAIECAKEKTLKSFDGILRSLGYAA
jgi:hypothetical protein